MALNPYPGVDHPASPAVSFLDLLRTVVNNLLRGKINAAVEFTPVAATTSTVITDTRITPNSVLLIEPTSSAGATELAGGGMFVDASARGAGTCTVTHTTGAGDELFRLLILS